MVIRFLLNCSNYCIVILGVLIIISLVWKIDKRFVNFYKKEGKIFVSDKIFFFRDFIGYVIVYFGFLFLLGFIDELIFGYGRYLLLKLFDIFIDCVFFFLKNIYIIL